MNRACGVCLVVIAMVILTKSNANAEQPARRLSQDERRALLDEIRSTVKTQTGWTRIRAAEALIGQGHADETLSVFRPLIDTAPSQERIGVWRVLAQAELAEEGRQEMVERIWRAFLDENGSDRLHAIEALAKLGASVAEDRRSAVDEFARRSPAEAAFSRWLLTTSGDKAARKALVDTLKDRDPIARLRASYSLSQLAVLLTDAERQALFEAARSEPADSSAFLMVIGAAARAGGDRGSFRAQLVEATRAMDPEQRRQAAYWLADVGAADDRTALAVLSKDEPAVRMTAANALLKIDARLAK